MKPQIITSLFFFVFFLGFQMQAAAQASASVSYTIVVTEDMLAGGDDENRSLVHGFNRFEARDNAFDVSHVSVQLQSTNNPHHDIAGFEIEMNPANSSDILSMLQQKTTENNTSQTADLKTESVYQANDQYHVVMEYN